MRKTTLIIIILLGIYLNALFTVVNFRYFNFSCTFSLNIVPTKEETHWRGMKKITFLLIKVVNMTREKNRCKYTSAFVLEKIIKKICIFIHSSIHSSGLII